MVMKYIVSDDFCEVVVDHLKDDGLVRGQRVYIVGQRALPISEEDPYTQRIKFFAHILKDAKTMEFDQRMFLLDPSSLKKVGKKEQEKLTKRLLALFEAMKELPEATVN